MHLCIFFNIFILLSRDIHAMAMPSSLIILFSHTFVSLPKIIARVSESDIHASILFLKSFYYQFLYIQNSWFLFCFMIVVVYSCFFAFSLPFFHSRNMIIMMITVSPSRFMHLFSGFCSLAAPSMRWVSERDVLWYGNKLV